MDMKVHCPGCARPLRVAKASSGRKARCPNCQRVFVVPKADELVDETISTWIEEDIAKLGVEHEKHWESIGSIKAYQRPGPPQKLAVGSRLPPPPAAAGPRAGPANGNAPTSKPAPEPIVEANDPSTLVAVEDLSPITTGSAGDTIEVKARPAPVQPAKPLLPTAPKPTMPAAAPRVVLTAPPPPVVHHHSAGPSETTSRQYPSSLGVDPRHPHLVITQCDQSGVTFAFDSAHLEQIGFRTAIPVRCAFSGETERRKLSARPLAFIDRSGARFRAPGDLEQKHTTTLLSGQSVRDLLDVMGNVDLPKPFSFCVPYYSSNEFSHVSMKCWTESRSDGGITCYVMMPNGPTALLWLLNVNGTCGPEYSMLEADIGLLDNEAWRQLGDECRRRLAVWCPFEPMEQFRLYLSDGDFGTRDKGLAGLVLTDRRLIYCKYHHRGAIDLSQPATLRIRDETDFAQLTIENLDGRTKLVKLHLHDVPTLLQALSYLPTISVDRKAAAAPAPAPVAQ